MVPPRCRPGASARGRVRRAQHCADDGSAGGGRRTAGVAGLGCRRSGAPDRSGTGRLGLSRHGSRPRCRRRPPSTRPICILVGASSVDGSTGAVGAMIAELLGLPYTGPVLEIEPEEDGTALRLRATVQHDDWTESVLVQLPAVVAVAERSCPPVKAPPETWPTAEAVRRVSTADLSAGLGSGRWGLAGSPTKVSGVRPVALTREPIIFRGTPQVQATRAIAELARPRLPRCAGAASRARRVRAAPAAPRRGLRPPMQDDASQPGLGGPEVVVLVGPGPTRALVRWLARLLCWRLVLVGP